MCTMVIVIGAMEVRSSSCSSTGSKLTEMNCSYFAGSDSPNATTEQSELRTRKRRKPNAMRYSRGSRRRLTPSVQATSVFSFELEGEPVTPLAINEYVERLQEDAANTGEEKEVKKLKLQAMS